MAWRVQVDAWRVRMAKQKQMVLQHRVASVAGELDYGEMAARGTLYVTDTSMLVLMEHLPTSNIYTVLCTEIREVAALGRQVRTSRRLQLTPRL